MLLSLLLHLAVLGAIFWLLHESTITPKAISRDKITLELSQIQTLPPRPPGARPTPKIPPKPKPRPRPKTPQPPHRPAPKPRPQPAPKKAQAPKEAKRQTAQGEGDKNPRLTEANLTRQSSKTEPRKKVIVMKITPKKHPPKPKKKALKRPAEKRRVARKSPPIRKTAKTIARRKVPSPHKRRRRPPSRPTPKGPDSRLIHSLYGSSYSRMSASQRRFIDENLRRILQISQRTLNYLGYPQAAARFGEQGTNVVEFWLYPNGDISGLRLRRRLNSHSLNRQTLEVIRTAYMHYPRPRVKTKIIIYVRYRLY